MEVAWLRQDELEITDVARGFRIRLNSNERSVMWLANKLEMITAGTDREGQVRNRSDRDLELTLRTKSNKGGTFLTILARSRRFWVGRKFLCCAMEITE